MCFRSTLSPLMLAGAFLMWMCMESRETSTRPRKTQRTQKQGVCAGYCTTALPTMAPLSMETANTNGCHQCEEAVV